MAIFSVNPWFLPIFVVYCCFIQAVQAQEDVRSLNVVLQLDTPFDQGRQIEVSVRNHGFLVIPPAFTIIRPIISSVTQTVTFGAGESSASLTLSGIATRAVDYSIQTRCINCANSLPVQYYTTSGVSRVLSESAYINPEDLAPAVILDLSTLGAITGQIQLADSQLAEKSVRAVIRLFDAQDHRILISQTVVIPQGQNSAAYRVAGLDRRMAEDYRVSLLCRNCRRANKTELALLDAGINHQDIDFLLTEKPLTMSAALMVLLGTAN